MNRSKENFLKLKDMLDDKGFKTTWKDPFFTWVHNTPDDGICPEETDRFYIKLSDVKFRRIPCDLATVVIVCDNDTFHFELTFYFNSLMEEMTEAEEFSKTISKHGDCWFPLLRDYLDDIERLFGLEWETRYDTTIEDCLHGIFDINGLQKIVNLAGSIYKALETVRI